MVFNKQEIEIALDRATEMGEDFQVTLCSDTFDILPRGEESRTDALSQIDLDQLRHVSSLHHEVITSLK